MPTDNKDNNERETNNENNGYRTDIYILDNDDEYEIWPITDDRMSLKIFRNNNIITPVYEAIVSKVLIGKNTYNQISMLIRVIEE